MAKIYQRAEDKNVATNVIYFSWDDATLAGTAYAYGDINRTKKMTKDELYKAFVNGCVAVDIETNGAGHMIQGYKVTRIYDVGIGNGYAVSFLAMANGEVKEIVIHSSEYTHS